MHEIQVKALEKQKEEADQRAIQFEEQQRKEREKWKQEQARKRQEQLAAKEQARKDAEAMKEKTGKWLDFGGDKVYFYLCYVDFIYDGKGDLEWKVEAIDHYVDKEIDRKQDNTVDTEDCESEWIEVTFDKKSHREGLIAINYNKTTGKWFWGWRGLDIIYNRCRF